MDSIRISLSVASLWLLFTGGVSAAQPAQTTPLAFQSLMVAIDSADEQVIAVGEQGHVLFSSDNGRSWAQGKVPVDNMLTAISMINADTAWAVGHDGVVLKTLDGGENWRLVFSQLEHTKDKFVDPLLDVVFRDDSNGLAVGSFGQFYRSSDGGKTWSDKRDVLPNEDELHFNSILRVSETEIWIASEYGMAFRSSDNGESWETVQFPADGTFFTLGYDLSKNTVVIAGIAGNAFSYDLESDAITPIKLQTQKSVYGVLHTKDTLHLVGAGGVWQQGEQLHDTDGSGLHAITQSGGGSFAFASAQGVQVFDDSGSAIKPKFITVEGK